MCPYLSSKWTAKYQNNCLWSCSVLLDFVNNIQQDKFAYFGDDVLKRGQKEL